MEYKNETVVRDLLSGITKLLETVNEDLYYGPFGAVIRGITLDPNSVEDLDTGTLLEKIDTFIHDSLV